MLSDKKFTKSNLKKLAASFGVTYESYKGLRLFVGFIQVYERDRIQEMGQHLINAVEARRKGKP